MATLKRHLKKILGLASIAALLLSIAIGILIKEKNNPKVNYVQSLSGDYQFENRNLSVLKTEIESPQKFCSELLEKDENTLVFEEYSNVEAVECMFVGCGGIF